MNVNTSKDTQMCFNTTLKNKYDGKIWEPYSNTSFGKCPSIVLDLVVSSFAYQSLSGLGLFSSIFSTCCHEEFSF